MLFLLLSCLFFIFVSPSSCEFTQPTFFVQWRIGELQRVSWKTDFREYTVGLWQRYGDTGDVQMGRHSMLYETREGDGNGASINWVVQTYGLDLDVSHRFFFWLFEGNATQQGNITAYHGGSTDFVIKAALPTTTTTSASASPTNSGIGNGRPWESVPLGVGPTASLLSSDSSGEDDNSNDNLSRNATIGIGVGISIIVVAAFAVVLLWWRYLRMKKKRKDNDNGNGSLTNQQGNPPSAAPTPVRQTNNEDFKSMMIPPPPRPAPSPIEMPTSYHNRSLPSYCSELSTAPYDESGNGQASSYVTTPDYYNSWHSIHPALK